MPAVSIGFKVFLYHKGGLVAECYCKNMDDANAVAGAWGKKHGDYLGECRELQSIQPIDDASINDVDG